MAYGRENVGATVVWPGNDVGRIGESEGEKDTLSFSKDRQS